MFCNVCYLEITSQLFFATALKIPQLLAAIIISCHASEWHHQSHDHWNFIEILEFHWNFSGIPKFRDISVKFSEISVIFRASLKNIEISLKFHWKFRDFFSWNISDDFNFKFRYVRLRDLDIPREKRLNYLQTMETMIRCCVLQHLIWVCTLCLLPF